MTLAEELMDIINHGGVLGDDDLPLMKAATELTRLQEEVERLKILDEKITLDTAKQQLMGCRLAYLELKDEMASIRSALQVARGFMRHSPICNSMDYRKSDRECTCGFQEALAQCQEGKKEDGRCKHTNQKYSQGYIVCMDCGIQIKP